MSLVAKSWHWTSAGPRGFVAAMDNDAKLIRQLCTRAGCIMEDASVIALIWDDGLKLEPRLQKLRKAAADIEALVAAATALLTKQVVP